MTDPIAADPPAAPVVPPAPSAPATPPAAPPVDPAWLNDRIAQAKKNGEADALKALGVANVDEAKAAIAAAKAAADTKKSAEEKAAEYKTQLEATAAKAAALEGTIKDRVAIELSALTAEQKAAVQAVAGDDAAAQLRAIDKLKPTWAAAPTSPAADPAKPPSAKTTPATTAPTREAPGSAPPDPTNHLAVYTDLKATNPMAAAQYRKAHRAELAKAESQKT